MDSKERKRESKKERRKGKKGKKEGKAFQAVRGRGGERESERHRVRQGGERRGGVTEERGGPKRG